MVIEYHNEGMIMPHLLNISEAASLALHASTMIASTPGRKISTRELAERLNASSSHLAKVMQRLSRARIVSSTRGPSGGFLLHSQAGETTLLDIYELFDGELEERVCIFQKPVCEGTNCIFGSLLSKIRDDARATLITQKLKDFIPHGEKGLKIPPDRKGNC